MLPNLAALPLHEGAPTAVGGLGAAQGNLRRQVARGAPPAGGAGYGRRRVADTDALERQRRITVARSMSNARDEKSVTPRMQRALYNAVSEGGVDQVVAFLKERTEQARKCSVSMSNGCKHHYENELKRLQKELPRYF